MLIILMKIPKQVMILFTIFHIKCLMKNVNTLFSLQHQILIIIPKYIIIKRVKLLNLSNIEPKGILYQYANKSYSKQCLKDEEFIDILNENIEIRQLLLIKIVKINFRILHHAISVIYTEATI